MVDCQFTVPLRQFQNSNHCHLHRDHVDHGIPQVVFHLCIIRRKIGLPIKETGRGGCLLLLIADMIVGGVSDSLRPLAQKQL
jgi:hypothetical protein